MKSKCGLLMLAFVLLAFPVNAGDLIGIYFDSHGTGNCVPSGLNTPLSAYVILKHPTVPLGLSAWEATIAWDPGISVSLVSVGHGGVNAAVFPSLQVNLSQPAAPIDSLIVLATLAVSATQPGALYLRPFTPPSVPGALSPIYAAADDPEHLVPTVYEFGSAELPVASVGEEGCSSAPDSTGVPFLYFGGQVVTMFSPGVVQSVTKNASSDSFSVTQPAISSILEQYSAHIVAPAAGNSSGQGQVQQSVDLPGTATLCDRSHIYYISSAAEATNDQLVRLCDALSTQDGVVFSELNLTPVLEEDPPAARGIPPQGGDEKYAEPNDPRFGQQWYLNSTTGYNIGLLNAWDIERGLTHRVDVAVLDGSFNGIGAWYYYDHEDLNQCGARLRVLYYPGTFVLPPTWNGHGFEIAGLIGGCTNNYTGVSSINPMAYLWDVNVAYNVDSAGQDPAHSSWPSIYDPFQKALDNGSQILQCAWTWPLESQVPGATANRTYLELALADSYKRNAIVVAGMGNYNASIPRWPAAFAPAVIAVGAVDENGAYCNGSYGAHIDIAAPGANILRLGDTSGGIHNTYTLSSTPSTSCASAIVSGIASLLLSYRNDLYNTDIDGILKVSAVDVPDLPCTPGYDLRTGFGRVKADAALAAIRPPHMYHRMIASGQSTVNQSYTGRTLRLILQTSDIAAGTYSNVTAYKCRREVVFDHTYAHPPAVWCRSSDPEVDPERLGYTETLSSSTANYGIGWCDTVPGSVTTMGCILQTYTYYVPALNRYVPCVPDQLAYAFTVLGDPIGTTGVLEEDADVRMLSLVATQRSPVGARVALRLSVGAPEWVSVVVYDVRGRLVRRLAEKRYERGWYDLVWDGRASDGRGVASGVYYAVAHNEYGDRATARTTVIR